MKKWNATLQVARWEFLRYLKIKQQVASMLITFLIGAATFGVMRLADRGADDVTPVAAVGLETLPVQQSADSKFQLRGHAAVEEEALRAQIASRDLAGLLIIRTRDSVELVVRKRGDWVDELRGAVTATRQQMMMSELGLQPAALAAVLAPPSFEVTVMRRDGATADTRLSRVAVAIVLSAMLMSIFIGLGYIFASITGEKQIRVTEQIISAIPAQSWIDGKILGLVGVSLVTVLNTAIAGAALVVFLMKTGKGASISLSIGSPVTFAIVILFAILGMFFWFAFLGAVAAVIDDPNNSSRGSLLMVPIFATALAFLVARNPDGGFARALSLLPPTAPSAMPARIMVSGVSPLEILLSLLLLAGGVFVLRVAAGRIFRLGMLMYGKEPTWQEMKRWAMVSRAE